MFAKIEIYHTFAKASPTRPAPAKSSRVGTQQRYAVVAVRCRSLAFFVSPYLNFPLLILNDFYLFKKT